jgi:hypothetical protein
VLHHGVALLWQWLHGALCNGNVPLQYNGATPRTFATRASIAMARAQTTSKNSKQRAPQATEQQCWQNKRGRHRHEQQQWLQHVQGKRNTSNGSANNTQQEARKQHGQHNQKRTTAS